MPTIFSISAASAGTSLRRLTSGAKRRGEAHSAANSRPAVSAANSRAFRTRRQHLDLHARHVDAGRAFAPAGLAGDAKLHRLRHRRRR